MRRDLEDSYRKMAAMLTLAVREDRLCSVLIASALRNEGASVITLQVGILLAKHYGLRPLIIEMNFRKPRLLKKFGLDPKRTFFAVSEGLISPCDAIQSHSSGVDFVAAGRRREIPRQDPAPTLNRIVEQGRLNHNIILIDAPPILEDGSLPTIAPIIPRMILVVRAGKTSTDVLQRARNELDQWQVSLVGAVLNKQKRYLPRWIERLVQ